MINYDLDALLYIDAIQINQGIGLSYQTRLALNNLAKRMKGQDSTYANFGDPVIWNQRIALYPYVGVSASAFKYNFFYPTESTADGRQTFYGGGTYTSFGHKGNGINAFAYTNINSRTGLGSVLSPSNMCVGIVYKDTITAGRDDFGTYNTNSSWDANIWLRTFPTPNSRMYCYENGTVSGAPNGGRGHWMLSKNTTDRRLVHNGVYYSHVYGAERPESSEPDGGFGTITTGALNYNNQGNWGFSFVNFSANTNMFFYILGGIPNSLHTTWHSIVESFCTETGKKTW